MKSQFWRTAIVAASFIVGCARVDARRDWDRAAEAIEGAVGESQIYRPDEEDLIDERLHLLLSDGLTIREAVQATLLNNPHIQSELLKVGIARSDFVQSGLLSNPSFSFAPRWPDGGGMTNLQFGVAQNIAELWQLPFRKGAAQADLNRTVLEVASEASATTQRAVSAYLRALHAEQAVKIVQANSELMDRLVDLATGRRDAGAGSDLDIDLARAQRADVLLRSRQWSVAAVETKADLIRLIGLECTAENVLLVDAFPTPTDADFSFQTLIAAARDFRLDLQAAGMAVEAAAARIEYEQSRVLRSVELGLSVERNAQWDKSRSGGGIGLEGAAEITGNGLAPAASLVPQRRESESNEWVVGPSLSLDIPIFDQNQAQIAKARFIYLQAKKMVRAMECDLFRDAEVACMRLKVAGENTRLFKEEIIPLRERVLSLGEDAYRAGRTSFLAVVQSQQSLQEAKAGYIDALRDYALAIVEIERIAGCPYQRLVEAKRGRAQKNSTNTSVVAPREINP